MLYFSFEVHHFLPLRIQWLYGVFVIIMFLLLFQTTTRLFYIKIKSPVFKSYLFSGICSLAVIVILFIGLWQIGSINRQWKVTRFLQQHEQKLTEVVNSVRFGNDHSAKVNQVLDELNVRLINGPDGSCHFELYSFLGYGYRILFTRNQRLRIPISPGGSPTVTWFNLKKNWFYYSYFD
jgi:hypothetical protein